MCRAAKGCASGSRSEKLRDGHKGCQQAKRGACKHACARATSEQRTVRVTPVLIYHCVRAQVSSPLPIDPTVPPRLSLGPTGLHAARIRPSHAQQPPSTRAFAPSRARVCRVGNRPAARHGVPAEAVHAERRRRSGSVGRWQYDDHHRCSGRRAGHDRNGSSGCCGAIPHSQHERGLRSRARAAAACWHTASVRQ